MSEQLYYARRSLTYGHGAGKPVDRGQVIELQGMINDEKLVRLGYVALAPKHASIVQCGTCGAEFITDEGLNSHGRSRHAKPLDPNAVVEKGGKKQFAEDHQADQRAKLEDEMAPLYLDKTTASRS